MAVQEKLLVWEKDMDYQINSTTISTVLVIAEKVNLSGFFFLALSFLLNWGILEVVKDSVKKTFSTILSCVWKQKCYRRKIMIQEL